MHDITDDGMAPPMGDSGTGPAGTSTEGLAGRGAGPRGTRRRWCLAGAGALGLAACGRPVAPDVAAGPLRLAMDLWPGYYPAVLADELGYLADAQVPVQFSFPANTDSMIADFAAGHVDLIAVAMGDLINATHGRGAVQVFLVTDESAGGDAVLARPGLDLKGRRRLLLATNLGGFGELLMREFVQRQGLDPQRVAWINADAADVPRLLAAGDIDIGHTWEPYASEAEAAGAQRLFSSADTPGLIPDVLAASRATIERRQAELKRFSAAWLRAADWWVDHFDEGAQRIAGRLHSEAAKISLKGVRLMRLADNRRLLGAGGQAAELAAVVQRYSAFFLDRGALARPVEPAGLLRADLLP